MARDKGNKKFLNVINKILHENKTEKYQKILKLKKFKFSDFELITNYGLFSGDTNLFKTLTIFQLIYNTRKIKGSIIEFGIHKGNTSLLIKKILDIYKIKKNYICLTISKDLFILKKRYCCFKKIL